MLEFLLVFFLFLLVILIVILFCLFIFPLLEFGAPFEGTKMKKVREIFNLANPKKGEIMADLGSGDGRIVIEFARKGIEAHGYEINPFLVFLSRRKIRLLHLQNRAFIHCKSFWKADFSKYNIITMFQYKFFMKSIEKKIKKEAKPEAKIISNHWKFPTLKLIKKVQDIYLYKRG